MCAPLVLKALTSAYFKSIGQPSSQKHWPSTYPQNLLFRLEEGPPLGRVSSVAVMSCFICVSSFGAHSRARVSHLNTIALHLDECGKPFRSLLEPMWTHWAPLWTAWHVLFSVPGLCRALALKISSFYDARGSTLGPLPDVMEHRMSPKPSK